MHFHRGRAMDMLICWAQMRKTENVVSVIPQIDSIQHMTNFWAKIRTAYDHMEIWWGRRCELCCTRIPIVPTPSINTPRPPKRTTAQVNKLTKSMTQNPHIHSRNSQTPTTSFNIPHYSNKAHSSPKTTDRTFSYPIKNQKTPNPRIDHIGATMADTKATEPQDHRTIPGPTDQNPAAPTSSSIRSRIFSMNYHPKVVFRRRAPVIPSTPPSPEQWQFVTRQYRGKGGHARGNLPESMNGKDAQRKLDWIDRMLQSEEAYEQSMEWETEGRDDEEDERWSKRVFWDRRREEIWRKAAE